jgi:hypothetical protein
VTLFFHGVFTVRLPAVDFFTLVTFNSVVFILVVFVSKFLDSVAFVVVTAVDLVGVGLDFFPPTFLSLAILAFDLVRVGLDFSPLNFISFPMPAFDLVGGVILFFQLVSEELFSSIQYSLIWLYLIRLSLF